MEPINKINVLVGLDLSEMDKFLVRYIRVVRKLYPIRSFTFLHNVKLSELPEELQVKDKLDRIEKEVHVKLHELIKSEAAISEPYNVMVSTDNFSELAFLGIQKRLDAKLLILGNKQQMEGSGGLPQKLIRMLPSAVLLVPETFNNHPEKIIAAIDFSNYSNVIYQVGRQIIQHSCREDLIIDPVYVAKVSWNFFPGLSENDIRERLEEDVAEKHKKWLKNHPDAPQLHFIRAGEKSIASNLLDYANRTQADIMIVGAKGASSLAHLFIGSVANELIQRETDLCILLVKRPVISE